MTTREVFVGPVDPFTCSSESMISAETTALGAWAQGDGGGLGYRSVKLACGAPQCETVVWLPPGAKPEDFQAIAERFRGICIVQ